MFCLSRDFGEWILLSLLSRQSYKFRTHSQTHLANNGQKRQCKIFPNLSLTFTNEDYTWFSRENFFYIQMRLLSKLVCYYANALAYPASRVFLAVVTRTCTYITLFFCSRHFKTWFLQTVPKSHVFSLNFIRLT